MLFTNLTQFAVLLLMLFVGWLFGFASHPGGRKWKQAYRDEQAARAEERRALEQRNAELTAELERARTPVAASAAVPAVGPVTAASRPAGPGDDLTRLRGVDAELAGRFKAERVTRFADVAGLTDQDEIALERRIDLPAGYIQREQLREQARLLADGDTAGHASRFS